MDQNEVQHFVLLPGKRELAQKKENAVLQPGPTCAAYETCYLHSRSSNSSLPYLILIIESSTLRLGTSHCNHNLFFKNCHRNVYEQLYALFCFSIFFAYSPSVAESQDSPDALELLEERVPLFVFVFAVSNVLILLCFGFRSNWSVGCRGRRRSRRRLRRRRRRICCR